MCLPFCLLVDLIAIPLSAGAGRNPEVWCAPEGRVADLAGHMGWRKGKEGGVLARCALEAERVAAHPAPI